MLAGRGAYHRTAANYLSASTWRPRGLLGPALPSLALADGQEDDGGVLPFASFLMCLFGCAGGFQLFSQIACATAPNFYPIRAFLPPAAALRGGGIGVPRHSNHSIVAGTCTHAPHRIHFNTAVLSARSIHCWPSALVLPWVGSPR